MPGTPRPFSLYVPDLKKAKKMPAAAIAEKDMKIAERYIRLNLEQHPKWARFQANKYRKRVIKPISVAQNAGESRSFEPNPHLLSLFANAKDTSEDLTDLQKALSDMKEHSNETSPSLSP